MGWEVRAGGTWVLSQGKSWGAAGGGVTAGPSALAAPLPSHGDGERCLTGGRNGGLEQEAGGPSLGLGTRPRWRRDSVALQSPQGPSGLAVSKPEVTLSLPRHS